MVIISGGTITYIRPHLALSAPAYGKIGDDFELELNKNTIDVQTINMKTKMADSNSKIETNKDLSNYINELLKDNSVKAIILAAAICDFDISCISGQPMQDIDFNIGKSYPRLSSNTNLLLHITPAEKLAQKIKAIRPDIFLVTFKTTSNQSIVKLESAALDSLHKNKSDVVFGNDIVTHENMAVSNYVSVRGTRTNITNKIVHKLLNAL